MKCDHIGVLSFSTRCHDEIEPQGAGAFYWVQSHIHQLEIIVKLQVLT